MDFLNTKSFDENYLIQVFITLILVAVRYFQYMIKNYESFEHFNTVHGWYRTY